MDNNQFQNNQYVDNPYENNLNINNNIGPDGEKKKSSKFGSGFFTGFLCASIALVLGVTIYTAASGKYIILGGKKNATATSSSLLDKDAASKINELNQYIDLYYYDEYDKNELKNSMYKGLMEGLGDPYTVYYTEEDYKELEVSTSGTYYGIGAGLTQDTKTMTVTITKIYSGTPSEEAGLLKDDIILEVDGTKAESMELDKLVKKIRGEEGTSVHLKIYRSSTKENLEFDVERRNVELPSVEGKMLKNDIGYIQISEFQTNTADQFDSILTGLEGKGMKGLIIDVRSNPGGLLSSVVDICDRILPEGTVVYTEDKYGKRDTYTSDASCVDYPIIVLVDGNSASASEIFAGAIKDYKYGTLVGTNTFGKGIVQSIFQLKDGDAIKVTTAKYFTPNGNYIHGKGIAPDVEIEYEYTGPEDKPYKMKYDNQLQKAIKLMKKELKK